MIKKCSQNATICEINYVPVPIFKITYKVYFVYKTHMKEIIINKWVLDSWHNNVFYLDNDITLGIDWHGFHS